MSTAVSQDIMFVNEMHVYKLLWRMRENKGVKLFEIEFDNWRVLKPRGSSLSGLLALGGLQEGCE